MVKYDPRQLNQIFHALSDPTRRAILERLAQNQLTVSELAEPFSMSLPAVSKHVRILEESGLLRREIQGRIHQCHLESAPLKSALEWIAFYKQFWDFRLDALDDFLQSEKTKENPCGRKRSQR